jgi:hypothetical protein
MGFAHNGSGRAIDLVAGLAATIGCALSLGFVGCGTPGAPQPPSLKLPEPVTDLTAVRAGNTITLHWTMSKKTTDHLLISSQIRGPVPVEVCRRERATDNCQPVSELAVAAGIEGEFRESLPAALASGDPRPLFYFVKLKNKPAGRSAGLSNGAATIAGAPPAPISGLHAAVRADGVALHWDQPNAAGNITPIRLHRRLLTLPPPKEKTNKSGPIPVGGPAESVLRDLVVDVPVPGHAAGGLDSTARFGESYEYTAQRFERLTVDGKTLELASEVSGAVHVDVVDNFPPAVPAGLAAVAAVEEKTQSTIDLSWQANIEEDLAGYIVYRAETGSAWKRVSGQQPLPTPAWRDTAVEPGHSYRYVVTAIDRTGHESQHSAEAEESVPSS